MFVFTTIDESQYVFDLLDKTAHRLREQLRTRESSRAEVESSPAGRRAPDSEYEELTVELLRRLVVQANSGVSSI